MPIYPICSICSKKCESEIGNNPDPIIIVSDKLKNIPSVCCDECFVRIVLPAREQVKKEIERTRFIEALMSGAVFEKVK